MRFEPLTERGSIDLHDSGFGEGVCTHEFVVRGMVGHGDDAHFAGNAFRTPGEIARVEAKSTVFGVAAAGTDKMDAFGTDTSCCWLATFFEGSGICVRSQ